MSKYDFEFKLKVVQTCLKGNGVRKVAEMFAIPSKVLVQRWLKAYKTLGKEGLTPKKKVEVYSVQFKVDVVNYMLREKLSPQETAIHFKMHNPSTIQKWKNDFIKFGVLGLSGTKGRPVAMDKQKKPKKSQKPLTKEQQLKKENELLRAELAFIKKLRALGMNVPNRLKMK